MNFDTPVALHDYRYLGEDFRERERIKRKKRRWSARLAAMPILERQALMGALAEVEAGELARTIANSAGNGDASGKRPLSGVARKRSLANHAKILHQQLRSITRDPA